MTTTGPARPSPGGCPPGAGAGPLGSISRQTRARSARHGTKPIRCGDREWYAMCAAASRDPAYQTPRHKNKDVARRRHVGAPEPDCWFARISRVWAACVMAMDHDSLTGSHRIALMQGMQPPPECSGQVPALAGPGDLQRPVHPVRTMITMCFGASTIESSAVRCAG